MRDVAALPHYGKVKRTKKKSVEGRAPRCRREKT